MISERTLKDDLRDALHRGADHETLARIVQNFYAAGGTQDQAYETLQEIWRDYGYDGDDARRPDQRRNDLEFMMERVWYWRL
jgi:hypothetical protein